MELHKPLPRSFTNYVHTGTRYIEAKKYCPEIPDWRVLCCTCKYTKFMTKHQEICCYKIKCEFIPTSCVAQTCIWQIF
jgi:hypothetical protein